MYLVSTNVRAFGVSYWSERAGINVRDGAQAVKACATADYGWNRVNWETTPFAS